MWEWVAALLRRSNKLSRRQALEATHQAVQSRVRADSDLAKAVEGREEAARITERLREHNAANSYDDWLTAIVRR